MLADDNDIANLQRAAPDENGCKRATTLVELRFDDRPFGRTIRIGLQFKQFGLQRNFLDQLVEAGLLERRHFDVLHVARHFLDDDFILQQRLTHLLRIGFGLVRFRDRDDHRHACGLGMVDRFDRLRLDAVIGGNNQHNNVGDVRATLAHVEERFVARRVEERDLLACLHLHLIGADMLGDPARFAAHHISAAQRIEQRGFAMIDMPHDGHDRRTNLERIGSVHVLRNVDFDIAFGHAGDVVAEFGHEQFGGILVDIIAHCRGLTHFEQRLDQIVAAFGHTVGKFAHRDSVWDDHVTDLLGLRLAAAMQAAFLFASTLQRGKRTGARAFAIGVKCTCDGEFARLAAIIAHPRACGTRGFGATFRHGRGPREMLGLMLGRLRLLHFGFGNRFNRRIIRRFFSRKSRGFFGFAIFFGAAFFIFT